MASVKAEKFLDAVRRSGLVEKDQLRRAMSRLKQRHGSRATRHADSVAEWLIDEQLLNAWQCEKLLGGRHKGFFLGKYKLLDHLGSGGMSSVYLGEHVLMQRLVAVKVLPKSRVKNTSYLARFHREAQAAAVLDHPNIVRAYDVDNDGDLHYLVMEYIDGCDLQVLVRQDGPVDFVVAADYIRQAATGLAHAHAAGLIHRDVKPANLLVDRHGAVKVLDLGLARFADDEGASLTVAHDETVLGTADYLAPEQALDSHGADSRADIYGLGCSFYFLLTGHAPFPDGSLPQRLMMHQNEEPPSILDDRPDAPEDLLVICRRMMAKLPDDRFQTADEVAHALRAWMTVHGHFVASDEESGSSSGRVAATRDTITNRDRNTVAGLPGKPPITKPARISAAEPARMSAAEPARATSKTEYMIRGADSPVRARLRSRDPLDEGQIAAYQPRSKGTPLWLWAVLAAGLITTAILLVALLWGR